MCGIAGFVQRAPPDSSVIERMLARLRHRGPDGCGTWQSRCGDWIITLGHRRLAIIDLAGGHEPIGKEAGSRQVIYNGEIYNFRSLRADLELRGHRFSTHCDCEVIVHHVEEHGATELEQLDGMFAFAAWDQRAGQLLLARDRAGIKPLYFAPLPDGG